MGKHSLDTPGRKRKDLDATKLDWLDVATKVIVLVTSRGSLGPRVSTSWHSLGPFLLCSRNSGMNCAVTF